MLLVIEIHITQAEIKKLEKKMLLWLLSLGF